ncbi:radical SAM protein [Candidatus Fermentibacteria bacterium]|nr:radical SAM protein [Candidatus Fermentibacteria bacterium]
MPPPLMLMADSHGAMFEHPEVLMAGASGTHPVAPSSSTIRPVPAYTKLFFLPGCAPVGLDPSTGKPVTVRSFRGRRVCAVASFLPPGHLRLLLPAALPAPRTAAFPLWAYSAVGWDGGMVAPYVTLDATPRWSPENYDDRDLLPTIEPLRRALRPNRLLDHLVRCATEYHCFAAKNLFLGRWEAPLPVSRRCNAACLGCLSLQPPDGCAPSHDRIAFTPTVDEVARIAVHHLDQAEDPIVSFGQGCEGEPLTEADLIEESIYRIRACTLRGVVNLNTNGYSAELLRRLVTAGLDSVRVSMASARPDVFAAYHKPAGFSLADVEEAVTAAGECGAFTMLNYLVFPGVTDQPEEMEALIRLVRATGIRFIHLKNLNIDPWFYVARIGANLWSPGVGMEHFVQELRAELPGVELGYFNRWEISPGVRGNKAMEDADG